MALPHADRGAAAEDDAGFCIRTDRENTYRLRSPCATVPDVLCALAHELNPRSTAYSLRDHPHDAYLIICISAEALALAVALLSQRLTTYKITKGATEDRCAVQCPAFLEANILRRGLLTLVDVLACSSVRITKNTSDHEDWIIAHRCGQLAIVAMDEVTSSATLKVRGRSALGRDLCFATSARVADGDLMAPLVDMQGVQELEATLFFTRDTPLQHAKFHCVAAPSYLPEVACTEAPTREQRKILHEYTFSKSNVCRRKDGRPCRSEVLRELVPEGLEIKLGPKVVVGVESLGQMPAAECVQRTIQALLQEAQFIRKSITECSTAATSAASAWVESAR